jgi:glycosyltransferase involved in cell wall biosynthesis
MRGLARTNGIRSIVAARADEPLERRCRDERLEVVECSPRFGADPAAVLGLRRLIMRERVTIVHAHTSHALTLAALATLHTPVPIVAARRVDFPPASGVASRWKYSRPARLVAVSEAVARVMVESGIDRERIDVVYDGVDLTRSVEAAGKEILVPCGIPERARLVVQVAQLVAHKDPLTFVRAMTRVLGKHPEVHAVMLGDGPLRGEVQREVRSLLPDGRLHLLGYRSDADSWLAAAHIVTLSSAEEGLGSVLLDALAFGKPIAATSAGGIPEVVEDGVSGLLSPPGDPAALGAAVDRLLSDTALARSCADEARKRAQRFSVERMVSDTMSVYERASGAGKQ